MTAMEGPHEEELDNTHPSVSVKGSFRVTHAHVRSCMDGLGRWVLTAMDAMEETTLNNVVASVGDTFVLIADGIHRIVLERDSMNDAGAELPPYCHTSSSNLTCVHLYIVLMFIKSASNDGFQNKRFPRSMKRSPL